VDRVEKEANRKQDMRRVLVVTKNTTSHPPLVVEFPWAELGAFHPRRLVCNGPYLGRDIVITRLSDDIQPIGGPSEDLNFPWRNIMRSHQHLKLHGYESADLGSGGLGRLEKGGLKSKDRGTYILLYYCTPPGRTRSLTHMCERPGRLVQIGRGRHRQTQASYAPTTPSKYEPGHRTCFLRAANHHAALDRHRLGLSGRGRGRA
jgi:hypothetical protein